MHGKDRMTDDILQSAKKAAAAMIAETSDEVEKAVAALRVVIEAKESVAFENAKAEAERAYSRAVKLGDLEANKILLEKKQSCVAAVYAELRALIVALPKDKYLKLMRDLVLPACSDGDEIVAGRTDTRITAEWVKKIGAEGKKKIKLSAQKGDFDAGVVIRNAKYDRDFTVDTIVEEMRTRTEAETARKLGL